MIKVKEFNDIKEGDKVIILSSYSGYVSFVPLLNEYVGSNAIVMRSLLDNNSVQLKVSTRYGLTDDWWYPPYSLIFEGDDEPITVENVRVGNNYTMMCDNLNTFELFRYENIIPDYKNERGFDIINNSLRYPKPNRGTRVKVLQVINVNPEYNDIIVLCELGNGQKHYLPITSLYGMLPSYNPRKFVYEYNQWKNK